MLKKPLILVTGATAFVGRDSVAQLVDAHHPVRALVRDPAKAKSLGEAVEIIVGDLVKPDLHSSLLGVQKGFVIAGAGSECLTSASRFWSAARNQ